MLPRAGLGSESENRATVTDRLRVPSVCTRDSGWEGTFSDVYNDVWRETQGEGAGKMGECYSKESVR